MHLAPSEADASRPDRLRGPAELDRARAGAAVSVAEYPLGCFSRRERSQRQNSRNGSRQRPGLAVTPVDAARAAVEGADIILSAIPQGPPPIANGAWLEPGALVVAFDILGTWDDGALGRFGLLATDSLTETSEHHHQPTDLGPVAGSDCVIRRNCGGRTSCPAARRMGPILAVPGGVASIDVAVAWAVYRQAQKSGRGRTGSFASRASARWSRDRRR